MGFTALWATRTGPVSSRPLVLLVASALRSQLVFCFLNRIQNDSQLMRTLSILQHTQVILLIRNSIRNGLRRN